MRYLFTAIISMTMLGIWRTNAQEFPLVSFEQTPLKEVIRFMETEMDLSFSYAEDVVEKKAITFQGQGVSVDELLLVLESQTGLHFEKMEGQSQIIIVPLSPSNEICLFLLDKETRRPISENQVIIDSIRILETNPVGLLRLAPEDTQPLTLTVLGYETLQIQPSDQCTSVYLSPVYKVLDEVVVTSYITSGIDRNRDGSITLNQKPLGAIPGLTSPDILQSIQMVPGVVSLDESASGIQIHGGTPDQNLILFDHIRLFNTGYLFGMLSRFNPYVTEKAKIFKTATSAAYGDRVSGVVDIHTAEALVQKTTGGFGLDGLSLDGYLKTPLSKKSSIFLFARRSYPEVYKSPTYEAYAKKIFNNTGDITDSNGNPLAIDTDDSYTYETSDTHFRFYDINVKYIYEPTTKDKISLSALMTRNRTDFSFANNGESKRDSLATGNGGFSLNWSHKGSLNRTEEITAYFSSYDSFYQNEEFVGGTKEETNIRGNRISDFGLDLKSDRYFANGDRFVYGYQLSNTNLEVDLSTSSLNAENDVDLPVQESNFKNVLFGEYTIIQSNSGIFKMGLRAAHYGSLAKIYLEPRLNMELPIAKNLRLRAGLERRNQPISQLIEFNQTELRLENNLWRLSDNVDFPLLQSHQISSGLLFDKNGWTLDTEVYYKHLTGLTSYSQGFNLPQPNLNTGRSSILGMDLLIKKRVGPYRIWMGYTFNNINYEFEQLLDEEFPGNNDVTHNLRLSNSVQWDNFEISLGWQLRTGSPFTPIEEYDTTDRSVSFGSINSGRLPTFHRLDASLTYQVPLNHNNAKLQLGVSALNLYNRVVPLSIIYRTDQTNNGLLLEQVIYRHSLDFTPNLSLRLFF